MLPFGIGFSEVLLIVVVFLLVVGPKRLPDVAKTAGKGLRMVRKAGRDLRETIDTDEIKRQVYQPIRQWQREQAEAEEAELIEERVAAAAAKAPKPPVKAPPAIAGPSLPVAEPEDDEGPAIVARSPLVGSLKSPDTAAKPAEGKDAPESGPEKPG